MVGYGTVVFAMLETRGQSVSVGKGQRIFFNLEKMKEATYLKVFFNRFSSIKISRDRGK